MFRYYYKDPDGDITEIVGLIRENSVELVTNADEGSVGSGTAPVNDPAKLFNIRGHRLFVVVESEATSDDFGGVVWVGYTFERTNARNIERADGSRDWGISLVDVNTLLSDRIQHGKDVDRPEESDIERVTWLLSTAEMGPVLDDTSFVADSDPEPMDKTSYDGETCLDILDDAAQQSGRNYFVLWQDSGGTVPDFYLWYRRGDSSVWSSDIRISNVRTEIDHDITWPSSFDAELTRDPSRVYSNIRMDYDGGFVNEAKESTATRFRRRWTTGQAELVKTEAKARRRAKRTLNDIDTELDTITVALLLPRAKVNAAMAGQRIQVHFTHLQGYSDDFVWMRIRDRTVREVNPELVEVAMTLTGDAPEEGPTDEGTVGFATLDKVHQSNNEPHVWFEQPGDTPPSGWPGQPTTAPVTPLTTSHPSGPNWTYYGWSVDSDFTGDISFHCSAVGVQTFACVFTWAILVNGEAIGTFSVTPAPGFRYVLEIGTVEVTGYDFHAGDIIEAYLNCSPSAIPFFRAPGGTGTGSEAMKITNAV